MLKAFQSDFFILKQYLGYFLTAVDQYSLHSPFIFQFYTNIIQDRRRFYAFDEIEAIRSSLIHDPRLIEVRDLGTGSRKKVNKKRRVADIARNSLSKADFSRLLFRMVLAYKPRNILELGTSLGINASYLAKADSRITVTTLEGCPEISRIAQDNFHQLKLPNIHIITDNIDESLPLIVDKTDYLDFVYFDANHSLEATFRYFEQCLKKTSETSIFIFDDIHLSREMHTAWNLIKENPAVSISIDLFDAGILFFRQGLKKEHYILEF